MFYYFADSDSAIQVLQDAPQFFSDAFQWGLDASYVYLAWCSLLTLTVYFFKR